MRVNELKFNISSCSVSRQGQFNEFIILCAQRIINLKGAGE